MKKMTNRARAAAIVARAKRKRALMVGGVRVPATSKERWDTQVEINANLLQQIHAQANRIEALQQNLHTSIACVKEEHEALQAGLAAVNASLSQIRDEIVRVRASVAPLTHGAVSEDIEAVKAAGERTLRTFDELASWQALMKDWCWRTNDELSLLRGGVAALQIFEKSADKNLAALSKRVDRLWSLVDGSALRAAENALRELREGVQRAQASAANELTPEQRDRGLMTADDEEIPF